MKTIIVPSDFSKESLSGLDLAILIANKTGANIQMVHVITGAAKMARGILEKERELAKIRFEELIEKYHGMPDRNLSLNYIIKEGKIYQEVINQANSYKDSLIVLSTHGASGLEEFFIGSNAYKIASASSRPVITVRSFLEVKNIKKIILPLDLTLQSREKVPFTAELAKVFNSEIGIVTLRSTKMKNTERKLNQYSEQVGSFMKNHKIPFHTEHLEGSNFTNITLEYATSVNADLISIMTEQDESVTNLIIGNYAQQMVNKSLIPVLLFPNYSITIIKESLRTQGIYIYEI